MGQQWEVAFAFGACVGATLTFGVVRFFHPTIFNDCLLQEMRGCVERLPRHGNCCGLPQHVPEIATQGESGVMWIFATAAR